MTSAVWWLNRATGSLLFPRGAGLDGGDAAAEELEGLLDEGVFVDGLGRRCGRGIVARGGGILRDNPAADGSLHRAGGELRDLLFAGAGDDGEIGRGFDDEAVALDAGERAAGDDELQTPAGDLLLLDVEPERGGIGGGFIDLAEGGAGLRWRIRRLRGVGRGGGGRGRRRFGPLWRW